MRRSQVFISYRREDSAGYARAIYDELAQQFGADRVFIDVDDINAGQPFGEVIASAIGDSVVLLVLIGPRWLGEHESGAARIDDAGDLVRQEVAAGLSKGMRVIPLLLDGVTMPTATRLPEELRPLAQRNALSIDNARFGADIARLVAALRGAVDAPAVAPSRTARRWGLAAAAVIAATAAAAWWQLRTPEPARPGIEGQWQADVTYDWPGARYTERFAFTVDGTELHGSASFLGLARGVLEGRIEPGALRFVTRTNEVAGAAATEVVHRYRGRLVGDEIRFVMQTEGGSSTHLPVEFVARRSPPASAPAGR